jgi:hypothetical protein
MLCSLLGIVAQTLIGIEFKVKQNILRKLTLPFIKWQRRKAIKMEAQRRCKEHSDGEI